ncbi:MAG: hypothetical protein R3C61_15975, partial [Bacteroidia bacterium]
AAGRWWGVDAMAEAYYSISPFAYVANNPVIFIDPNGEEIWITIDAGTRVQYRNGGLYDQDENEYVAEEGSFAAKTLSALNHIAKNGGVAGKQLITYLTQNEEEGGGNTWISETSGHAAEGGGVIYWNPEEGLINEREEVLSPALGLAHELGHTYNELVEGSEVVQGRLAKSDPIWSNAEEKYNIETWEQPISTSFEKAGYGSHSREHHGLSDFVKVSGGPNSNQLKNPQDNIRARKVAERLTWPSQQLIKWRKDGKPGRD